ncbi:hypothetical protein OPV22_027232 [Ensete ventricosum]|uniref:Bifunctional inhibitor/plant lipid transfer protein/seed storage helical domain-containing protein n=1 Tax=Ensete ventricosum TaxID=4639 RepID=A0AAV8PZA5_ENSVE|nr:hypothetical protein OPV22_027232 [Ensete ventricosum]
MTRRASRMGLVLVLVAVLCAGASAQSSGCTSALLTSVVGSEPQCLCMVLNGGASSLGITVNQTQAMALPAACKIKTPPVSECSSAGAPSGSPTTPSVPSSDGGSKTLPTLDTSSGSRAQVPSSIVYSLLFAVASLWVSRLSHSELVDSKTSLHVC